MFKPRLPPGGTLSHLILKLHQHARTRPDIRRGLRESTRSQETLAQNYRLTRDSVRTSRLREWVTGRFHRPYTLQAKFSPLQEAVRVPLRRMLLPPLALMP